MSKVKLHLHWFTMKNTIAVGHYSDDAQKMCRCGEIQYYSRPRRFVRFTLNSELVEDITNDRLD